MQVLPKLILLYTLTVASCATNDQSTEAKTEKKSLQSDTVPAQTDTLIIDRKAAVFFQPDSLQIEKQMKETGEEDFRAGMDDYLFYMNASWDYLKSQGLSVLDAKDKKFIRFHLAGDRTQLVKLDTLPELWGIYFFVPTKSPYKADITIIEDEYKNYYP